MEKDSDDAADGVDVKAEVDWDTLRLNVEGAAAFINRLIDEQQNQRINELLQDVAIDL